MCLSFYRRRWVRGGRQPAASLARPHFTPHLAFRISTSLRIHIFLISYFITHSYWKKIKQRVLFRQFLIQFSTKLHQNLINSSLGNGKCMCKIWGRNICYFLSYRVHRQTHTHQNPDDDYITS